MHDIRYIRDNPQDFDAAMARRGLVPVAAEVLELDAKVREVQTQLQGLQEERNTLSRQIGELKSKGEDAQDVMDRVGQIKQDMPQLEEQERELQSQLHTLMAGLPNALDEDVPDGEDENSNKILLEQGTPPKFNFAPHQHFELGEELGMMDFERATRISGSRFVFLTDDLARMERALSQLMLDVVGSHGFREVVSPLLLRENALFGSGQLPKFEEDLFKTQTGHYLIPTSEASLANMFHGEILAAEQLPARLMALTPCFRSEAGAAGRDTRGMIRMHQFYKVEMVAICHPDESEAEHQRMTGIEEEILQKLGLAYRKMLLCSGDTGATMRKTYDMEVWLPGQDCYREISSCSNAGEYQARRMNTRFREQNEKQTKFVHTLNGSALAVGRTLIAVMENYQQQDGSIQVPEALQPYMGGQTEIVPRG